MPTPEDNGDPFSPGSRIPVMTGDELRARVQQVLIDAHNHLHLDELGEFLSWMTQEVDDLVDNLE